MKSRGTLFTLLIFAFSILVTGGCASSHPQPEVVTIRRPPVFEKRPRERAEGLKFKGARSSEEDFIKEAIGIMTEGEIAAAKGVTIVVYRSNYSDHFEESDGSVVVGHYHSDTKIVCFRADYLDRETIWHEICHAYHDTLNDKFDNEWLKVAGDVYEKDYEGLKFPRKGLMKRYASHSYHEDVATWLEEIYCYVAEMYMSHNFGKIDRSEKVYLEKLDLLLKWKFIIEDDYKLIKPMLVQSSH